MKPSSSGKRVAIVGAGIAGIAASIRLAVHGWEVDVFEANGYPGGKLTAFVQDGFRFDAGPSMFTMPGLVDELFQLAGKDAGAFAYTPLEEACRYFFPDGTGLTAWTDPERFGKEVEERLGVPADVVLRHLGKAGRTFALTKGIFMEKSLHKASTYFSLDALRALLHLPVLNLLSTMDAANTRSLRHPKLVQIFNRYATYNGSSPYSAPAVLNLIPHLEHGIGAAMPKGGMHAITERLVALARELGVRFHLDSPVDEILVWKNKASGLIVRGKVIPADRVVCNMDIVPAYHRLLPGQKAPARVLRHERSSSAMIFYWGIKRTFPALGLHNIFFTADYKAEFDHIFRQGSVHEDPTVYVNISAKACPEDAPDGMENWFVMVNVPSDTGQDWETIRQAVRKSVLTKLSHALGTEIAPLIVNESHLDPPGIARKTSSLGGALYGGSSNQRMSAFLRHANFSGKIGGLFFCGGSVHPGGGIPLCLLSAKIVSEMVGKA